MSILPLVDREFRTQCRRSGLYWARTITATTGLGVVLLILWAGIQGGASPSSLGRILFTLFLMLGHAVAIGYGPRLLADSISSEKREGTLGLLFLTDLKHHDIVLGKMAGGSLVAVYELFGIVPGFAITLILGGVSLYHFFVGCISIVSLLAVSLAAATHTSTGSLERENAKRAASGTITILSLLIILFGPGRALFPFVNPSMPFIMTDHAWFWIGTAAEWGLAALLVWRASWKMAAHWRAWENQPAPVSRAERKAAKASGDRLPVRRAMPPRAWLGENPIFWLAARNISTWKWMHVQVAVFSSLMGLFILAALIGREYFLALGILAACSGLLTAALIIAAGGDGAGIVFDQKRSGSIEFLLATPLDMDQMEKGIGRYLARKYLRIIRGCSMVTLVSSLCLFGIVLFSDQRSLNGLGWCLAPLLGPWMAFCSGRTAAWSALWTGVSRHNARSLNNVPLTALPFFLLSALIIPFVPSRFGPSLIVVILSAILIFVVGRLEERLFENLVRKHFRKAAQMPLGQHYPWLMMALGRRLGAILNRKPRAAGMAAGSEPGLAS